MKKTVDILRAIYYIVGTIGILTALPVYVRIYHAKKGR